MKKVLGIGGVFFKSKNPKLLREWYKLHLGLDITDYGVTFENYSTASKPVITQWNPFEIDTKYFNPSKKEFMINYRVENLELLAKELETNGVRFVDKIDVSEYGKFLHILDLEDNILELWEEV